MANIEFGAVDVAMIGGDQQEEARRRHVEQERERRKKQKEAIGRLTEKVNVLVPNGGLGRNQIQIFELASNLLDQLVHHGSAVQIIKDCLDCTQRFEVAQALSSGLLQRQRQGGDSSDGAAEAAVESAPGAAPIEDSEVFTEETRHRNISVETDTASEGETSPLHVSMEQMEQEDSDVQHQQNVQA